MSYSVFSGSSSLEQEVASLGFLSTVFSSSSPVMSLQKVIHDSLIQEPQRGAHYMQLLQQVQLLPAQPFLQLQNIICNSSFGAGGSCILTRTSIS